MARKTKCHYCSKPCVLGGRRMGGEIYCVNCATRMQSQLNIATQKIRRLKIQNPKLFSVAPRKTIRSQPVSPPSSTHTNFKFSKSLENKEGTGIQIPKSPGNEMPFAPTPRPVKTTSVKKLRKFFELQRKEKEELVSELKRVRSRHGSPTKIITPGKRGASSPFQDKAPEKSSTEPGSNLIASKKLLMSPERSTKSTDKTFESKSQRVSVVKAKTSSGCSQGKHKKIPSIVHKAMEFTERRAEDYHTGIVSRKSSSSSRDSSMASELNDLKEQMRAFKKSQTNAIKTAAKDKQVLYNFESKYSIQDDIELGSGLTAVVKLCVDNITKNEYAVKIISKANSSLDVEIFHKEVKIMEKMKHANIIGMVDCFETTDFIYIVQEVAYGGELFDRILEQKQFSEKDASEITKQILSALVYMHSKGIVHRDLKPENILYSSFDEDASVKISDFGFATEGIDGLTQKLGTQGYCAPEVFSGFTYDSKCDIWSLGVIVYILISGLPPFIDLDEEEETEALNVPFWIYVNRMQEVQDKEVKFKGNVWKKVSSDAKEFLTAALQINPKKRACASDLMRHTWMTGRNHKTNNLIPDVMGVAPLTLSRPQDFVRSRFDKPKSRS